MKVSLNSYFDPWSKHHHGLKNFKVVSHYRRAAAVIFSTLAGAVSFGIFALPVFRVLTHSDVPTQSLASRVGKVWIEVKEPSKKRTSDSKGRTDLHHAIFQTNGLESVQRLIKKGANINKKDHQGYTALNYAMMDDNIEIFNYLIENKINLNSKNHQGLSPLALAIVSKKLEFVKILVSNGADLENCAKGSSALHLACMDGDLEMIELLLKAGASPDRCNPSGVSPLALARIRSAPNYQAIKELFLAHSPLSISYESESMQRHLIGHAFSLSLITSFLPKEGNAILQASTESSIPIPMFWDEIKNSLDAIGEERSDLLQLTTQKSIAESLEFAKQLHSPAELLARWKEGKPVFIETGYETHFVAGILYKDHWIVINRGGKGGGKKVHVEKIKKGQVTEDTLQSIQKLTNGNARGYAEFMHQFPEKHSMGKTSFEKDLEETSNRLVDHQTVNNCAWANREGAALVLTHMLAGKLEKTSFEEIPLLQKCYFAENYLKTMDMQGQAYYSSPLLIAKMTEYLQDKIKTSSDLDLQTKQKVEESIKKLKTALITLQAISSDSMAPEVKKQWHKELKEASKALSR